MKFILKSFIMYCVLWMSFYSLSIDKMGSVNANEALKNNIEDFELIAGVETLFDTEITTEEYSFDSIGYTTDKINIREEPSLSSKVIETISFNTKIRYENYNDDWVVINHNDINCYVSKHYISDKPIKYTSYNVPDNSGFKSYMSYKAITSKNSKQYKLQQKAYTGNYGIRMVDDRYCVVLGSYFKKEIGTRFDLVLENGTIIKCILSDIKSSIHTKEDNITSFNGCVSEFVVDSNYLPNSAKVLGDMSHCNDRWNSSIVKINFY